MNVAEITKKLADNDMLIQQLMARSRMAGVQDTSIADYEGAQQKADSALSKFGRRAGPPLLGEPIMAYRRRLAGEVQKHSPKWKDFPLAGVRADAFESQIEAAIYADFAASPPTAEPGTLRAIPRPSYGGHTIVDYVGQPSAWMDQFAGPRQYVKSFNDKVA